MDKRQLIIGSLVIDLRQDITMDAVVDLMDSLIRSYAYYRDVDIVWYSDGYHAIKGQADIRAWADEMREINK